MGYRVLIVDDSKLARMSVAKLLSHLRPTWERIEAADADGAVALVKEGSIDIALVDFNMPGRDGLAFAAELKALHEGIPVAIVSANHQAEVVARAKALGAAFLVKPLTNDILSAFLDETEQRLKEDQS